MKSTPLLPNGPHETLGTLAAVVAENYGTCRENAKRLDDWIDWWLMR